MKKARHSGQSLNWNCYIIKLTINVNREMKKARHSGQSLSSINPRIDNAKHTGHKRNEKSPT